MAPSSPVSRRTLLKTGAAAALGSGSVLGVTLAGQQPASPQRQSAGTKFRAFVKHGATSSVEELTLRPSGPRQVLVRSLATGCCYYAAASLGEGGPLYQPAAEPRVVGPRWHRHRRGGWVAGKAGGGRGPRHCLRYAAVRRMLSMPARARLPVSGILQQHAGALCRDVRWDFP